MFQVAMALSRDILTWVFIIIIIIVYVHVYYLMFKSTLSNQT